MPKDTYGLNQDRAELYVGSLGAQSQTLRVLIPNHEGDIRPYAWTRDDKLVLYWRADEWSASIWTDGIEMYAIPISGGPERKLGIAALAHDDVLDLAPETVGNKLAATLSRWGRETWSGQQIVLVDLDAGATRELTAPDISAQCPAWSPDGRSIAYFAAPDAQVAKGKALAGTQIQDHQTRWNCYNESRDADMKIGIDGGEEAHRFLQQRSTSPERPMHQISSRGLTTFNNLRPVLTPGQDLNYS